MIDLSLPARSVGNRVDLILLRLRWSRLTLERGWRRRTGGGRSESMPGSLAAHLLPLLLRLLLLCSLRSLTVRPFTELLLGESIDKAVHGLVLYGSVGSWRRRFILDLLGGLQLRV